MNIIYFHANLLRDTYRCSQVRTRLIRYLQTIDLDAIFISGITPTHSDGLADLKRELKVLTCPIIDKAGRYAIQDILIVMDDVSMLVNEQRFIPLDGSVMAIQTEPEIEGSYIALDIFADEKFSAYHGDMDAKTFRELREMIEGFPQHNKNHLH
jgi:hypothetical protein